MGRVRQPRESGLTLVELLAAMGLALILMSGLYRSFVSQTRAYALHNQITDMHANARFSLDTIVRDLQMAGYDPQASTIFGITAYRNNNFPPNNDATLSLNTNTELYFTLDSDGDAVIDNDSNERFAIRVNAGSLETAVISSTDGSIASWQPITDSIERITVSYTYADGAISTDVGLPDNGVPGRTFRDIRGVTISLTAKSAQPDPHYTNPTYGDNFRRITLHEEVAPRNLGL